MSSGFYARIPPFQRFEDFLRPGVYKPLPADWVVIIADIAGSTRAIDNGLYREVNLVGAASITQAMKALGTQDIPFVFGGDGASICVPGDKLEPVRHALAQLAALARTNFGLELRVASIPADVIVEAGKQILVGKLEITPGKCIAVFKGGGLRLADRLAKDRANRFGIPAADEELDNLEGLSCRWSPIPSRKGVTASLLVVSRDVTRMDVYRELIERVRQILGGGIESAQPVALEGVRYKSLWQSVREEAAYHRRKLSVSFLLRLKEIVLSVLIYRYGLKLERFGFDAQKYKSSIGGHSDYRKFDDTLRLVIDCSEPQYEQLENLLNDAWRKKQIFYGLFASDSALMTCFIESTGQGEHLHFIDGGDGGLAMAAKQLKTQMGEAQ